MAFQNRSVDVHQFAMIPRADIPRSTFQIQKSHKTTFDAGYLIPIHVDEVLPGDTFSLRMTAFGRLATPIVPIMDNLYLDSFFFFVPNRLVWSNWRKFMGEQVNPNDSISFLIPEVVSAATAFPALSIYDYMGLPTPPYVGAAIRVNAMFLRAYNLIWNEWFRDENIQSSVTVPTGDGPDAVGTYTLLRRGKRKDYFTGALPWPQKGGVSVPLPLGTTAPVIGIGAVNQVYSAGSLARFESDGTSRVYPFERLAGGTGGATQEHWIEGTAATGGYPKIYADLSEATAATINQLRQAFQIQKLLERDARGGTRYTELVRAHFGVVSPDARLQRPEYLGGGSQRIAINPVPQTAPSESPGTPQGHLAAMGTVLAHGHGFTQSFTEHGMIIGLVSVRADLNYQNGIRRMWQRRTKHDFYFPAFAALGEQAILRKEIWVNGNPLSDDVVFGYQERWAEYRYNPSLITGLFKSQNPTPIDVWHVAQNFVTAPTLSATFIEENPPLSRVLAVGAAANGQQLLLDTFFDIRAARPMPMYSVPGMIDHF